MTIPIPRLLVDSVRADRDPSRRAWLETLPATAQRIARGWSLELGAPFEPGGCCAWVAPATDGDGRSLVLKIGWRHPEAEYEGHGLRHWQGRGAVRCLAEQIDDRSAALLLERCEPGTALSVLDEPEQDTIIAGLLRRLWAQPLPDSHPFPSLETMCDRWADETAVRLASRASTVDRELIDRAMRLMRQLPRVPGRRVLLCTDLHAGNVLAAAREPWLVIDPKPHVGDPAYDVVQHLLNCKQRLFADPSGLANRMADLLDLDQEQVKLWLLARTAQDSLSKPALERVAQQLLVDAQLRAGDQ